MTRGQRPQSPLHTLLTDDRGLVLYTVSRVVTTTECPWLDEDLTPKVVLRRYTGATYGCITPSGLAMSWDGGTPFFEVPSDAVKPL